MNGSSRPTLADFLTGRLSENVEVRPEPSPDDGSGLDYERFLRGMRKVPTVKEREAHRNPDRAVLDELSRHYLGATRRMDE